MKKGKFDLLEKVRQSSKVEIHYIRQKEPLGLGHAVWCARKFIGDEPFAVLLGDDIVQAETPAIRQLIEQYEETGSSMVGVQKVEDDETHRYGIVDPVTVDGRRYQVDHFVEKPEPGTAPSNLAIMGRYVLTPGIFHFLEAQETGAGGEIQLTDAIQKLNEHQYVYAYDFEGKRYDVGEKLGFIKTTIEFALQNEEIGEEVRKLLKNLVLTEVHK
ncbi:UTP--glucose-1-phosphate uridylyltransferase, partial [Gracilibacillus dipsosauri]|uniref:UTP--glucose-1-phosphate uridylyltransferase n=1 Tax=Gracilibacillus dipsosauri TaxID=178340 RepID=UPI00240A7F10